MAGSSRACARLVLVSENSHLLRQGPRRRAAPRDAAAAARCRLGIERVRVSYLQPAEVRPALLEVMTHDARRRRRTSTCPSSTPRPRCCAGCGASAAPTSSSTCSSRYVAGRLTAGVRTNVIVGFPARPRPTSPSSNGSSSGPAGRRRRLRLLRRGGHRSGRPADGKLPESEIRARVEQVTALVEELTAQRAEDRIGEDIQVLVESVDEGVAAEGRAAHQAPEVDGATTLPGIAAAVGDIVQARVIATDGVDLIGAVR